MRQVRKAVFPAAGLGTRFLPATKACPKEMLPVVDRPLIQYAIDEAVSAGINQLIFVTARANSTIEDYLTADRELEERLELAGKQDQLGVVREILPAGVSCSYVIQPTALGLGHAVLCTRYLIGDEPFAVLLADDIMFSGQKSCIGEMIRIAQEDESSVVAVEEVPAECVNRYGVVDPEGNIPGGEAGRVHQLKGIVEKPSMSEAPSNLAVVGRYVLQPEIFAELEKTSKGTGGEIQLTDAISGLLGKASVLGYQFEGIRYDCGSKLGYVKANVDFGLRINEIEDELKEFLSAQIHESQTKPRK